MADFGTQIGVFSNTILNLNETNALFVDAWNSSDLVVGGEPVLTEGQLWPRGHP